MNKPVPGLRSGAGIFFCIRRMLSSGVIDIFRPITLEEMGKVKLMNRVDSKFITTEDRLENLLEGMAGSYMMQQIEDRRNMPYATRYFDTGERLMFYEHQRGKKQRQKIRIRVYEGNDMPPFLEIKDKDNRGRTRKKRVVMEDSEDIGYYKDFVEKYLKYPVEVLTPQIDNHFYRLTLVNDEMTERITIDTGLEFYNLTNDTPLSYDGLTIIEWKRDGHVSGSRFARMLRELSIHESGFSKYCVGMAATDKTLRQNRLKSKLKFVDRLLDY